jgi:EpsD family peptidyl-prolyl cis-trans isomerase
MINTNIVESSVMASLRSFPICVGVSLTALTLVACGPKTETAAATQIVAKVNNGEISVHQLNFVLQGVQGVPPDKLPLVKKEALSRLVDQEALVQQAISAKLDREPNVQQQLEAARRDILSKAYLQKISNAVSVPDQAAIDKFFAEKPALFQNRKIYRFAEINIPGRPGNWAEIEKSLLPSKSILEASTILKSKGLELPVINNVARGTEDLPLDVADKIVNVKDGEVIIYFRAPNFVVAQILSSKEAPVDEAKAKPIIERFLQNKSKGEAVQAEMKRLKEATKITYLGEFATTATTPAKTEPPAAVAPKATDEQSTIEKGLKGLR